MQDMSKQTEIKCVFYYKRNVDKQEIISPEDVLIGWEKRKWNQPLGSFWQQCGSPGSNVCRWGISAARPPSISKLWSHWIDLQLQQTSGSQSEVPLQPHRSPRSGVSPLRRAASSRDGALRTAARTGSLGAARSLKHAERQKAQRSENIISRGKRPHFQERPSWFLR